MHGSATILLAIRFNGGDLYKFRELLLWTCNMRDTAGGAAAITLLLNRGTLLE